MIELLDTNQVIVTILIPQEAQTVKSKDTESATATAALMRTDLYRTVACSPTSTNNNSHGYNTHNSPRIYNPEYCILVDLEFLLGNF